MKCFKCTLQLGKHYLIFIIMKQKREKYEQTNKKHET